MKSRLFVAMLIIQVSIGSFSTVLAQRLGRDGEDGRVPVSPTGRRQEPVKQEGPVPEVEEPGEVGAEPPVIQDTDVDFESLSQDLALMEDLFKGGNGQPVTFDAEAARQRGYSEASIKLAEELTAYTNDLIAAASEALKGKRRPRIQDLGVEVKDYRLLSPYLEKATEQSLRGQKGGKTEDRATAAPLYVLSEYYCGAIWRPLPRTQAPWRTHTNVSNPARTLRAWGYHETPSWAGGGWTRPQTHMWWMCGWNTYRDHAYIVRSTIHEQSYSGRTPRGEPNPEFWRSGPWPYATWPAYVAWWHQYGPGR